jgi:hypothetical protein
LSNSGFQVSQFTAANISIGNLKSANYQASNYILAGYTPAQLINSTLYTTTALLAMGFTNAQLVLGGSYPQHTGFIFDISTNLWNSLNNVRRIPVLNYANSFTGLTTTTLVSTTTGLTTATETVVNTDTTYTAGTGLTLTGTTFDANVNATTQTVASNAVSATASRTYAVQVDGSDNLVVNVPWSDTDTNTDTLQSIATDSANATRFITFVSSTTGAQTGLSNFNFQYNPSTQTLILAGPNNATAGSSQLHLNGASGNRIDWNTNGVDLPAFTTRSAGTKLLLYPALSGSQTDYAIGIDAATMWSSVPVDSASFNFKWYGYFIRKNLTFTKVKE